MSSSEKEAKELEKQKKDLAKLKAKLEKDAKKNEKRASDLRQARKSGSIPHAADGDASPISPRSSYVDLVSLPSPAEILAQSSRDAIPPVFEPATVLVPEKVSPLSPQKVTHPPPDRPASSPTQAEKRVTLQDFKIVKLIGKGGFGEVYLVEHKARKQKLALKVMEKQLIAEQNKIQHILNERDVLVKSKFCAGGDLRSLLTALGTLAEEEAKLYFAEMIVAVSTLHSMGYIHRDLKPDNFLIDNKGHLKLADFGLSKHGVTAPRSMKVDRMASRRSILLGDQQLEQLNQENFNNRFVRTRSFATLVNRRAPSVSMVQTFVPGQSKPTGREDSLTQSQPGMIESFTYVPGQTNDMSSTYSGRLDRPPMHPPLGRSTPGAPLANGGSSSPSSAQRRRMLAYSVVGSPDYMSPEVLNESGYSQEVDWWSLGCNFFEMIMGTPPFAGDSPQEVFENIQNWRTVLPALLESYREYMSPECFSLITGMLAEPGQRLGSKGIEEFKQHPFFAGLDWNNLHAEEPPFIPKLSGDDDTSYFNDNVSGIEGNIISVNAEGTAISKKETPPPAPVVAPSSPQQPAAISRQTTQVINASTSSRRSSDNAPVGHVRSFTFVGDGPSASPTRERTQSPSPPPIPQLSLASQTPGTPTSRPSPPTGSPAPASPTPGRPQPPNVTVPLMSATIIGAARPAAQPAQVRAPPLPAPPPQSPKTAVPPTVLKRGPAFSNGMGLPPAMPNTN